MASPCRSPISRQIVRSPWNAMTASSDLPALQQGGAEVVQRHALATPVTDVPADGGSVAARGDRFLKPARLLQRTAEVEQFHALATPVADLPEDGSSVLVSGDGLLEWLHACPLAELGPAKPTRLSQV
jgi:hypothetical protein